jgi:two-component system, OmpR family, phosphate regulon sensor histidine kinase PhoR
LFASPFFRRLFLPYLLLICTAVGAVGVIAAQRLRASYLERTESALRDESRLIAALAGDELKSGRKAVLDLRIRQLGKLIGCRITIIQADGTVIADNEADPATMDNHRLRPEIVAAAARAEGTSLRHSGTLHEGLMYFATRVEGANGSAHYVRLAVPVSELDRHLGALYAGIASAALAAVAVAGVIGYYFARRRSEPLLELITFADAVARGDLGHRVLGREKGEIGTLAVALNSMAESLSRLVADTAKDKARLLTILSSMSEGVVATDTRQRVVLFNDAAADLLSFGAEQAQGRLLWEVVRHEPLLRSAGELVDGGPHRSRTLRIGPIGGRHLQVTVCTFPLTGAIGGLVFVAHDATEFVRYQELRKEFVANVSHELRTPLTAIKGFTETLLDGAIHDSVKGPQYLATIEKHTDQLTNLVNDLLELSRLESHAGLPQFAPVELGSVVRKAAELLQPAARKKDHRLSVEVPPELPPVAGDPDYLERAVANLLENAVKYTPPGGTVRVSAASEGDWVVVEVTDNGIGIPAIDLPRIFERFYRVDRSRSREMGGTGLGLSIVKHVVQAHGGSVEVSSRPGAGSCFRLKLPIV